jgi:hypothetical protein
MMIKASGRSALVLAAGLFVCFAAPQQAAAAPDKSAASSESESAGPPMALKKYTKQSSRASKKDTDRKAGQEASKSEASKSEASKSEASKSSAAKKDAADDAAADQNANSSEMLPSVANANASVDTSIGNAQAMSARANTIVQAAADNPSDAQPAADSQVVAADQLNDLDRALQESKPAAPAVKLASTEAPPAPAAPVLASSGESSTWDKTSLIGKIFIACGALLTMASAARMFMA